MNNPEIDLDDIEALRAVDKSDMIAAAAGFADQCEQAFEIGQAAEIDLGSDKISNIVVLGMGGSGISGDVCRVLFADQLKMPLSVVRDYGLPAYVGSKTLVLAASYSGNTEETLSALDEALSRGAQVAVVSTGGVISQVARDRGLSLISIPSGFQPRAALGYLSIPLTLLLERLGFVTGVGEAVAETVATIKQKSQTLGVDSPAEQNEAKRLAQRIFGRLPIVYGSEGISGLAAFRFKCQFNENSKGPAYWNQLSELDHNELAGWELLSDLTKHFHLILLRDKDEHPQISKRFAVTRELIEGRLGGVAEFWSTGDSKMARLFSLIYLGDFTTVYLALLNRVDPSPVERIELLKKKLK